MSYTHAYTPAPRPNPQHPRPWHREAVHGDGPRRPLTLDERNIWTVRAELEYRAGRLTAAYLKVGAALLHRLGADGRCDPSHATLADDSGASPRTVRRALNAFREVGLLRWEQRLTSPQPWPEGGPGATRVEQTSNAYELLLPGGPVAPRVERKSAVSRYRPDCGGQTGLETPRICIPSSSPELREAAQRRLDAIQTARKAQRDQEWLTKQTERWQPKD